MGLDNGIIIRGKSYKAKNWLGDWAVKYDIPLFCNQEGRYELAYWRKCWNIREKFAETFENFEDEGHTRISLDELADVRSIMKYFLIENNWQKEGGLIWASGSIWSWSESIPQIADIIHKIDNLYEDLEETEFTDEDFEIYFYDSY